MISALQRAAAKQGPREPRCGVTQRALSLLAMGRFRGCGRIRSRELLSNSNLATTNMNRKKTSPGRRTTRSHMHSAPLLLVPVGRHCRPYPSNAELAGFGSSPLAGTCRAPTCSPREKKKVGTTACLASWDDKSRDGQRDSEDLGHSSFGLTRALRQTHSPYSS